MAEPAEIQSVKPRPVSKGDKLAAATMNEIIGAVRRVQGGVKPPTQVKPLKPSTPASSSIEIVDLTTTANVSLSGTASVDGTSPAGLTVLVRRQTDAAQNGKYTVSAAGVWAKVGQPDICFVRSGTSFGKALFVLSDTNTYTGVAGIPV
jgi:hypothetical protein